jgi:hypothetical protein
MEAAKIFGYETCRLCGTPVLDIVAAKTAKLCPTCFRDKTNPFFNEVVAYNNDGTRVKLRLVGRKRSPGHKAAKKRAKTGAAAKVRERQLRRVHARALRRLRDLYPDVFEVLLADERAKEGLEPWTIERALTPHAPFSHFDELAKYAGIDNPLAS